MKTVYTTGEAAKICKVSQQTIIRCFDSGQLKGFRVPGSRFRRIPRDQLFAFMKDNGIPTEALESGKRKVLIVDDDEELVELMREAFEHDGRFDIRTANNGFDAGMLEWGAEDLDFGLKAWLMGASVLNDPDAVIGHRFRASFDNFDVSAVQPLVNQLRMAFKNFDDPVWAEWVSGCRRRHEPWPDLWQQVWKSFEDGRESLERERAYLHERRTRDEYWFAEYFDLPWPRQTSGLRSG